MNTFNKSVVSLAVFTGSIGVTGGVVQAENNFPGDGDYTVKDLSDSERDMLVSQGILTCSVKPEIRDALGIIILQEEYSERGYTRSGIDGLDGKQFCKDTYKIQIENDLYVDGVVGNQMVSFFGGLPSLLREHGLRIDSGNNNVANPKNAVSESNNSVNNSDIDIDKVVIDKSDNILTAYDNGEEVEKVRISHGDDRTYTYYANGRQYTGKATTRTGTTKVYRTEDADYASKTLGGPRGSMGYARFFNGGLAVHVGNIWSASHGCVRVSLSKMKELVKLGFGIGDTVVVQE